MFDEKKKVEAFEVEAIKKIFNELSPESRADFEKILLGFSAVDWNSKTQINPNDVEEAILEIPAVDPKARMAFAFEKLNIPLSGSFEHNNPRFIHEAVRIGKSHPEMAMEAEAICLAACEHKIPLMQEAGIEGIENLYEQEPEKSLAAYEKINLPNEKTGKNYGRDARCQSLRLAFNLKKGNPEFEERIEVLSVYGLMGSSAHPYALQNLEKLALNVDDQYTMCDMPFFGDDNEDYHLAEFSLDQTDRLAYLYQSTLNTPEVGFQIREIVVKNSMELLKVRPQYAEMFTPTYIKLAATRRGHYQTNGWKGLALANYTFDEKGLAEFREIGKAVSDDTYLNAIEETVTACNGIMRGNEAAFIQIIKEKNKELCEQKLIAERLEKDRELQKNKEEISRQKPVEEVPPFRLAALKKRTIN